MTVARASRNKIKSSDGPGMETDQAEQLDVLLSQPAKIQNQNWGNEETDASMMFKRDNRSPSPLYNQDTQTEIARAEKKDVNSNLSTANYQWLDLKIP